ncbi:LCL3 [Candida jiufengensis]|uniref:LCL3 n=1 Tax=Candida jiufengensis TaxID=497108 RepID=UPI0022250106|nr:LCL3 [Candida jiufengensis]KAI5954462.1 LCL3 [Candida jiufengensis]
MALISSTKNSDVQEENISFLHPKVILLSAGITLTTILSFKLYRQYLRPIRSILDLNPKMLENNHKLRGYVTRVGDGDNFRFYHTPGGIFWGWGWLKKIPTKRSILKNETLMIRLCGIDAPERSHFGKPAQPFSEDALKWLNQYINKRKVTIIPYSIDQYKRIVAKCFVWKWNGRKDVSAEMLRNGIAIVYEGKVGAEFGDNEDWYRNLEKRAKWFKRGIWSLGSNLMTPGEYKKVYYRGE